MQYGSVFLYLEGVWEVDEERGHRILRDEQSSVCIDGWQKIGIVEFVGRRLLC